MVTTFSELSVIEKLWARSANVRAGSMKVAISLVGGVCATVVAGQAALALTINEPVMPSPTYVAPVISAEELASTPADDVLQSGSSISSFGVTTMSVSSSITNAHGQTCSSTAGQDEIIGLARALKWNPDLIYEYVYNNISTLPSAWSVKGPMGALIERTGSPLDQAELMAELLAESCYTNISYYFPNATSNNLLRFTNAELENWLDVDEANILGVLGTMGFVSTGQNSDGTWDLGWAWISVDIDGAIYHFNPSAKLYDRKEGLNRQVSDGSNDISAALGYSQSSFLTRATNGSTIVSTGSTPYVQGINRSNIRDDLVSYSDNLVSYINTNMPAASTHDIVGGQGDIVALVPFTPPSSGATKWGVTALSNVAGTPGGGSATIPDTIRCRMLVSYVVDGTAVSRLYTSASLSWKRLTVSYNSNNSISLQLDGDSGFTLEKPVPTGTVQGITITTVIPNYVTQIPLKVVAIPNSVYALLNTWGPIGQAMSDWYKAETQAQDSASTDEERLGRALTTIGYKWVAQFTSMRKIADELTGVMTTNEYVVGIVGMHSLDGTTSSPYLDLPAIRLGNFPRISSGSAPVQSAGHIYTNVVFASILESGVLEQMQSTVDTPMIAASTSKIFDEVMKSATSKVYHVADASAWTAVQPLLTGYSSDDITAIGNKITAGAEVWLPDDGAVPIVQWSGAGYYSISLAGAPGEEYPQIGFHISGGLSGGFGGVPLTSDEIFNNIMDEGKAYGFSTICTGLAGSCGGSSLLPAADPVDMVTGAYQYDHQDISVGSGSFPYGLSFDRRYDSGRRDTIGTLGRGWTDSFTVRATIDSNGFDGLGESSPVSGASAIAAIYVMQDIMADNVIPSSDRLIMASIVSSWLMEELTGNVVSISGAKQTSSFTKLADGTYNPPNGMGGELTVSGGAVTFTAKDKSIMSFDADGRVTSWQAASGPTVDYVYSGGNLSSVTNNMGRTLSFTYGSTCNQGSSSLLTQVADNTGRTVNYTYDVYCNLTSFGDALNHDTTYTYSEPGALEKIFYPSNPNIPFVTNTYDVLGRVASQLDVHGYQTVLHLSGMRAEFSNPDGSVQTFYFNRKGKPLFDIDPLGNQVSYIYDSRDRLVLKTMPEGNSIVPTYDANHNVLTQTTYPKPGSGLSPLVTSWTYDAQWNKPLTATNAAGNTTSYSYDPANGNLLSVTHPTVGGETPVMQYVYNARGQVTQITDPLGKITTNTYDGATEVLLSTADDTGSSGLNLLTQYSYDSVGNVATATDPRGYVSSSIYDAERRVTLASAPSSIGYTTTNTYDEDGNLLTATRATGNVQTISYSTSFKPLTVQDPDGNVTTFEYDERDRVSRVIDAESRVTNFTYDLLSRAVSEANPAIQAGPLHQLAYNANGTRLTLTDARGYVTTYTYDGFDRLTGMNYPDNTDETLTYDVLGNVLTKQLRDGNTITMAYDVLNRLESKSPQNLPTVTHTYDLANRPLEISATGKGVVNYLYDTAGRITSSSQTIGTNEVAHSIGYEYDAANNRTRVLWSDGYDVNYFYDGANRITSIEEGSSSTVLASYSYDALLPRRSNIVYGNGVNTTYSYADNDDLLSVAQSFTNSAVTFGYTYDQVHQRTGASISNVAYLELPQEDSSQSYARNEVNQYSDISGVSYTYDDNGNLINDGTNSYAYDSENRLVSVNAASLGNNVTFEYGPLGRRVSKTSTGTLNTATSYLLDGGQEIAEYDATGSTLLRRYIYGPGVDEPVVRIDVSGASSTYRYIQRDGLGSVVAISDAAGEAVDQYGYGPFGKSSSLSGNPYRFTGRRLDPETGLYYYRSRYYSPSLGRFMQNDTIGYDGGMNLYAYVMNDPINGVDPNGKFCIPCGLALGGALVGVAIQGYSDYQAGSMSSWGAYGGAAVGGAIGGVSILAGGGIGTAIAIGAGAGAASNFTQQGIDIATGAQHGFDVTSLGIATAAGGATSLFLKPVSGLVATKYGSVSQGLITKYQNGTISQAKGSTILKMFTTETIEENAVQGSLFESTLSGIASWYVPEYVIGGDGGRS